MDKVECVVVGAGVVGLAIAKTLAEAGREVVVLERERLIGQGVSSRNSEVIHAGIYYPVNSLKAKLCVHGRHQLYEYCAARNIPHKRIGKWIVATTESEAHVLEKYMASARANGVDSIAPMTGSDCRRLEPGLNAVAALSSPDTGIIDTHQYMLALQADLEAAGGMVVVDSDVQAVEPDSSGTVVRYQSGGALNELACDWFINSAGLGAVAVAERIAGLPGYCVPKAYLARGNYFKLRGRSPFSRLIYPIAEAAGLGVHLTLDLEGRARFGPDVEWIDQENYVVDESRRAAFARAIARYFPAVNEDDLMPDYVGIRPKIVGKDLGSADFVIQGSDVHGLKGVINLFGIESPGLTSSLAIGAHVASSITRA